MKAPAKDAAQTASIFKTRSFQFLVEAVGAENIAIALESNMTRVAELMKGERFTPETAFHMETTLGLPHGFFDQPNPALADETVARLKSPLARKTGADVHTGCYVNPPHPDSRHRPPRRRKLCSLVDQSRRSAAVRRLRVCFTDIRKSVPTNVSSLDRRMSLYDRGRVKTRSA